MPLQTYKARKNIPDQWVNKPVYLALRLTNSSSTIHTIHFLPGLLYDHITVFNTVNGILIKKVPQAIESGIVALTLASGETSTYLFQMDFCKTIFNSIDAELISEYFLPFYKLNLDKTTVVKKSAGILLSGILLMMVLFTLLNYIIYRRPEFLYNCRTLFVCSC